MIKNFNSYLIKENIDLNEIESLKIFYNTPDEAVAISEILMNLGYKVYDFVIGNLKKESNDWDCFVYEDDMFCLAKKSYIKSKFKEISYIDFINKYWNKKFKKIENPDLDPYGEEDWGWEEIKENIDLNEIESLKIFYNTPEEAVAISQILMNFGYKVYDFESVKKDANDWQCFVFYDHEFCLAKASFNLFTRFGSRTQKYKEINYIDFINKYGNKKIKKIENPDLDPYGEEDWGWEEIKENKITFKPEHKKLRNYNILFDNEYEAQQILLILDELGFVVDIHNVYHRSKEGWTAIVPSRKGFCFGNKNYKNLDNLTYGEFLNMVGINTKYKKIENPELDPYGEEDWGYEEITENKEVWIEKDHFETDDIVKDTRYPEFGKGVIVDASRPDYIIIEYENRTGYSEKNCEEGKGWSTGCDYVKYFRFLSNSKSNRKKRKKIERPDIDPYGEEDWGYEEIKENNEYNDLRGKIIYIQNQFEYDELMKYLENTGGYLWVAGQNPTGYEYQISIPRCLNVSNSGRLRLIDYQVETIKASDILKFKLKKFKKIEHPELDPYGEEDWGWEEIKENELKKYNELFFGGSVTKSLNRELKWGERDIRGESFFIKDLQKSIFGRKRLVDELKDKLIGKRVAFFYDRDRGIDGTERRKEIMTIKDVINNVYRTILFIGTPEMGHERSLVIREDYPITILPEQKRVFNEIDPYGEEDWGDEDRIEIDKLINENKLNESIYPPITITNKLEEYIRKYGWSITMLDLIGNTYVPIDIDRDCDIGKITIDTYVIYAKDSEWYIPFDCVEAVNKKYKKVENPELDPYGEEDWGWEEIK